MKLLPARSVGAYLPLPNCFKPFGLENIDKGIVAIGSLSPSPNEARILPLFSILILDNGLSDSMIGICPKDG